MSWEQGDQRYRRVWEVTITGIQIKRSWSAGSRPRLLEKVDPPHLPKTRWAARPCPVSWPNMVRAVAQGPPERWWDVPWMASASSPGFFYHPASPSRTWTWIPIKLLVNQRTPQTHRKVHVFTERSPCLGSRASQTALGASSRGSKKSCTVLFLSNYRHLLAKENVVKEREPWEMEFNDQLT